MTRVTTTDEVLDVELQGLHRLWALKRRIRVPLAQVRGATVDPGMVSEPKGVRAPGLHVPGVAVVGTFTRDGERTFWDVGSGANAVVIELSGASYDRLVVEVDDPRAVADGVNRALARTGG